MLGVLVVNLLLFPLPPLPLLLRIQGLVSALPLLLMMLRLLMLLLALPVPRDLPQESREGA